MIRHLCFGILWLGLLTLPISGAPIQLIDGLPPSYTPGQPVAFDVGLPGITNLGSYNVDIVLESAEGIAGVDFYFDVNSTLPASSGYIFPSSASFFDAVNADSTMRHRITLTDFDFTGVNVVPGTNDHVAKVVIHTAPTFAGLLTISVDTDGLIFDTTDVDPTPVAGFDALLSDIAASAPIHLEAVPEPSVICLLTWAIVGAVMLRSGLPRSKTHEHLRRAK